MPLKPGTPIRGLDVFKDRDPPVAMERHEYPEWVATIGEPLASMSELEHKDESKVTEDEVRRYFKLKNRRDIRQANLSRPRK